MRSKTGGQKEFTTKSTKDTKNGIRFKLQHPQPVEYKGVRLDCGYRVDLLVEDKLIILLMNFNVTKLKSGIKRFILLVRVLRGETILCLRESLGT